MADWGFDVNADAPCGSLTVEQRQVVEITRALAAGTRCLLLDEPTAALERGAAQRLFERIRQLREAGVAIMYISHHLEEVFEICTDVAVLRDGELVLTAPMAEVSKDDLVTAMVGDKKKDHDPERAAVGSPAVRSCLPGVTRRRPDALTRSGGQLGRRGVHRGVPFRCLADRARRRAGRHHRAARLGGDHAGQDRGRGGRARRGRGAAVGRGGATGAPPRRPGRGAAGRHRLHPRGPAGRGIRAAARRGGEHRDDDHRPDLTGRLRQPQTPRGTRRHRWPGGSRWCRPGSASRSGSCPAATSRR